MLDVSHVLKYVFVIYLLLSVFISCLHIRGGVSYFDLQTTSFQ